MLAKLGSGIFHEKGLNLQLYDSQSSGAGYVPMLNVGGCLLVCLSEGVYKWKIDLFKSVLGYILLPFT